jgi:hypothetical protein
MYLLFKFLFMNVKKMLCILGFEKKRPEPMTPVDRMLAKIRK